jgi:hypothetical protein
MTQVSGLTGILKAGAFSAFCWSICGDLHNIFIIFYAKEKQKEWNSILTIMNALRNQVARQLLG